MKYFEETDDLKIKEEVLKINGKSLECLKEYVEDIKIWLTTQPHLPEVLNDKQIESYLVMCKCNKEKAKLKIDMYFTMRSKFPDVFFNQHPQSERMKQAKKFMYFLPLPKLCSDLSRIVVIKVKPVTDPTEMDPYACFALLVNVVDIRLFEDICDSHTIIFDMEHAKISHLMKLTPMFIKTMFTIGEGAFSTRAKAFHIVNAPNYIDQTLLIVKSVIKPKLAERIQVHSDMQSAVKSLEIDVLPKDYGGNEKSLSELEEMLETKFDEYRKFFDDREFWKVDEDLRSDKSRDNDFFGCYGNFKRLEVD